MDTLNKISTLLKEQNKTQSELCEYIGVGKQAFTNWKSGATTSYQKKLPKIAEFLGVSVDYLLGNTNQKNPINPADDELSEYLEELKNRSEMRMLFSLAKGATKSDVEKAVAIIEALRKNENG